MQKGSRGPAILRDDFYIVCYANLHRAICKRLARGMCIEPFPMLRMQNNIGSYAKGSQGSLGSEADLPLGLYCIGPYVNLHR